MKKDIQRIDVHYLNRVVSKFPMATPDTTRVFAFMLHDYDTVLYKKKPRSLVDPKDNLKDDKGYPEMVPLNPRVGVKLTEKLQWFIVKQLVLSAFGLHVNNKEEFERLGTFHREYIKDAFLGLTKSWTAFTNGAGTEWEARRRNYITGWNLNEREFPILWENSCGGSTHELYSRAQYSAGYKIRTLKVDEYETWKSWTFLDHPEYFVFGTNSTPYGYDRKISSVGPWRVDQFHYLDGRHVPVPLMSIDGFVYVKTDRARILKAGENFPPRYNP